DAIAVPVILALISYSYARGYPRDLPSFPTRRSSDLGATRSGAAADAQRLNSFDPAVSLPGCPLPSVNDDAAKQGRRDQAWRDGRSEEHTSELQSRENLVCRLLLEKKNKKTNTIIGGE